jgi:hypothetical protein
VKFILSAIGVVAYAGLVAIIVYAITPTESAVREAAIVFVITVISCGVLVYLHPGPIVTDVP